MHSHLLSPSTPPGEPGPTLRDRPSTTPTITITPPARPVHEYEIEYLQGYIRATHSRLQQTASELDEARAQIEVDAGVIVRQNERLAALQDLVQKQKVTICNQSKTISDPRLLRRVQVGSFSPASVGVAGVAGGGGGGGGGGMLSLVPHPHPHGQQLSGGGVFETHPSSVHSYEQQLSGAVFETPSSVFDLGHGNDVESGGLSMPLEYNTNVSSALSSLQVQSQPQPQGQTHARPHAGNPNSTYATPPPVWDPVAWSNGTSSCASGYLNSGSCLMEIMSRFRELWAKTELFGQIHANTTNVFKDNHLDIRVKDYVMSVSDPHGASSLLDSPATRFFLVAKAINVFLVHEILKVTMIQGFNDQADVEILSLKEHITPDTENPLRHLLAISIVTQVQITRTKPGFAEFCQHKTREHMLRLWPLIGPLADIETLSQAWTDLSSIVTDAQNLALDMFSVPFEYMVDFPVVGDPVNPSTMINTDPFVPGQSQSLANSDWRIRLGVTPVVRARDNSSDAAAVTVLSLGHVLLRPGQPYR